MNRLDPARVPDDLDWRSMDEGGVEIAFKGSVIYMRDGNFPDGPWLGFTPAEWDAFIHGAKGGEFDDIA